MGNNLENFENLDISSLKKSFRSLFSGVVDIDGDPALVNEQLKNIRKVYHEKVNPEA